MAEEGTPNYRFYVQVDGISQAVFTELSGLQVETVVQEYEEGGNNSFIHRLPGRTKVGNVTLKRGVTKSNEFFNWYKGLINGKITRKHISVVMYDIAGKELLRWSFDNAYPVKWLGPQFAADGKTIAIETIELAHDGLRLE